MMNNRMIGGANKLAPLISFNSIVDTDIGLYRLIGSEYLDPKIFNKELFSVPLSKGIYNIYHRKQDNLLYFLANDGVNKALLDDYYNEFMTNCYSDILNLSLTTNMLTVYIMFLESDDSIDPTILCNNIEEEYIIRDIDQLKYTKIINIKELDKYLKQDKFDQFYMKDINDLYLYSNVSHKTFYISSFGPNLDAEDHTFIDIPIMKDLILKRNVFNIYTLYNDNLLLGGNKNNNE